MEHLLPSKDSFNLLQNAPSRFDNYTNYRNSIADMDGVVTQPLDLSFKSHSGSLSLLERQCQGQTSTRVTENTTDIPLDLRITPNSHTNTDQATKNQSQNFLFALGLRDVSSAANFNEKKEEKNLGINLQLTLYSTHTS